MARFGRSAAITLAILLAFWLIWSRLRFVVFVRADFWQLLLLMAVLAVALFVLFDRLFRGSSSSGTRQAPLAQPRASEPERGDDKDLVEKQIRERMKALGADERSSTDRR